MENKVKSGIMGFIVGDALGVPLEFIDRARLQQNKVVEMLGYGSHNVPKGSWSDDSSMVIATMEAIIDSNEIDYNAIMDNFILWYYNGKFTPNNVVFDIGDATMKALRNYYNKNEYEVYKNPVNCGLKGIYDNGNGSLMRMLPIAYYCYYKKLKDNDIYNLVKDVSSLTHGHNISILGCYIYVLFVVELLNGKSKEVAYNKIKERDYSLFDDEFMDYYKKILTIDISQLYIEDISSKGFVVDTLEAVIWCFLKYNSYKECVIEAINLGNDTDTIGALVGGLGGIYYGYETIPCSWLNNIVKKDYLIDLCKMFNEKFTI